MAIGLPNFCRIIGMLPQLPACFLQAALRSKSGRPDRHRLKPRSISPQGQVSAISDPLVFVDFTDYWKNCPLTRSSTCDWIGFGRQRLLLLTDLVRRVKLLQLV
jgi:hypothetical protein